MTGDRFTRAEDLERWPRTILVCAMLGAGVALVLMHEQVLGASLIGGAATMIRAAVSPWLTKINGKGSDGKGKE